MAKILIIEDDLHTRTGLEFILSEEGFQVKTAADGTTALHLLDNTYDIILCDWKLGKESGLELLEKIRSCDSNLTFIVMTAFEPPESYAGNRNLKITRWFTKPLNVNYLLAFLQEIDRGKRKNGMTTPTSGGRDLSDSGVPLA